MAFKSRPEFAVGKNVDDAARLFETRLKSARKIIAEKDERAAMELALLHEDRKVRPVPLANHRGEPRWEGSKAQKQLKKDVAEGKHLTMKSTEFYLSNPDYQKYPKNIIMGHVDQEVRLRKFTKQYRGRYGY